MTVDTPTAMPMEAYAAAAAPAAAAPAAPAAAAPVADASAALAPMEADPTAAAATEKEAAAAEGGGDKPTDAAAAADAAPADANGAAAAKEESKKSFPRCKLRLRLDSGCYLARMAKDDKAKGAGEKKEENKETANGDVAAAVGDASKADDAVLLPQELAAERGWLTDEHAAALERKLVEAASRLGNAAPPLWALRTERVSERFFRRRPIFAVSSSPSVCQLSPTTQALVFLLGVQRSASLCRELRAARDRTDAILSRRCALASEDSKGG